MSDTSTLTSSAAGRYANALFELAVESGSLEAVETDLLSLEAALSDSAEFANMIKSPVYSRDEQGRAVDAIAGAMGLGGLVRNVTGLMAAKRRLFALPELIGIYKKLMADHRGEVEASVTAARPLSDAQRDALAAAIKSAIGRDVKLNLAVDESLIGGLVVKVGSRMIDSSIRSKLMGLQTAMKEVG